MGDEDAKSGPYDMASATDKVATLTMKLLCGYGVFPSMLPFLGQPLKDVHHRKAGTAEMLFCPSEGSDTDGELEWIVVDPCKDRTASNAHAVVRNFLCKMSVELE